MPNLSSLPAELVIKIFNYLGNDHLTSGLSQTCLRLREISMDNKLWRQKCAGLLPLMCYTTREINSIDHYRTFFFHERTVSAQVKNLLDLLIYGNDADSDSNINTPNIIYKLRHLILQICVLNEFALPTLYKIHNNQYQKTVAHAFYAQICIRIILRVKGLYQLMDIAEYLEYPGNDENISYKPIDLMLGMHWLRYGQLEPQAMKLFYEDSTLHDIIRYVSKNRKSASARDTVGELNKRLQEIRDSDPSLCVFLGDNEQSLGVVPCFPCAAYSHISHRLGLKPSILIVPYWSFVVFENEQQVYLNSGFDDDDDDHHRTFIPYPTNLRISDNNINNNDLIAVDIVHQNRIRHIHEVPYLSQMVLDNPYPDTKTYFTNFIKCLYFNFVNRTNRNDDEDNDPGVKLQWVFFSNIFRGLYKMPTADMTDALSKNSVFDSIVVEKYYERLHSRMEMDTASTQSTATANLSSIPDMIDDFLKQAEIQVHKRPNKRETDPIKFRIGELVHRVTDSEPLIVLEWHKEHPKYPDSEPYYLVATKRGRKYFIPQKRLEKSISYSQFTIRPFIGEYFLEGAREEMTWAHKYAYPDR